MNKNLKERAITLIALIITIVVLIILAGVAISLSLGENGLFKKAKTASEQYQNAQRAEYTAINDACGKVQIAADGTVTMNLDDLKSLILENQNPVGTIISFSADNAPDGYIICNGQEISRTTYSKLFNVIGTKYGEGDGTTTFAVPNLTNRFLKGNTEAGVYETAGLPNVTGTFALSASIFCWDLENMTGGTTGAFTQGSTGSHYQRYINSGQKISNDATNYNYYALNASNSNSIYGNSTTVTPDNTSVLYCIKY